MNNLPLGMSLLDIDRVIVIAEESIETEFQQWFPDTEGEAPRLSPAVVRHVCAALDMICDSEIKIKTNKQDD